MSRHEPEAQAPPATARSVAASSPRSPAWSRGLVLVGWFLASILLAFILLPLLALAANQTRGDLLRVAGSMDVLRAIWLSLEGAVLAALLAAFFGVPLAYLLARSEFRGKRLISAIVDVPLAVPHTVAGIALLFVFGRQGFVGGPASRVGIQFWGTLAGIVVAMLFVSVPYTVNAARIGFEAIDPRLEKVARTLGHGQWAVFLRVTLPLAWRGIMTGITLTFARAIGEFGAVVILVYYPMTAPVKIYELFLRFGIEDATGMSLLLLAVSLLIFILLRYLAYGRGHALGGGR
ncbi:MAG TPA: ABC transporter permease [Alphaproteobacteria bacterium]|nr:ABC transporter permease [Alphaproteobacteria bacterium]